MHIIRLINAYIWGYDQVQLVANISYNTKDQNEQPSSIDAMSNSTKCITDLLEVDIFGSLKGITAKNIQDLEQLYLSHARVLRFQYNKSKKSKNRVIENYLVCSCEGKTHHIYPPSQQQEHPSKRKKDETHTNYEI